MALVLVVVRFFYRAAAFLFVIRAVSEHAAEGLAARVDLLLDEVLDFAPALDEILRSRLAKKEIELAPAHVDVRLCPWRTLVQQALVDDEQLRIAQLRK